jgi:hypothetical protein
MTERAMEYAVDVPTDRAESGSPFLPPERNSAEYSSFRCTARNF